MLSSDAIYWILHSKTYCPGHFKSLKTISPLRNILRPPWPDPLFQAVPPAQVPPLLEDLLIAVAHRILPQGPPGVVSDYHTHPRKRVLYLRNGSVSLSQLDQTKIKFSSRYYINKSSFWDLKMFIFQWGRTWKKFLTVLSSLFCWTVVLVARSDSAKIVFSLYSVERLFSASTVDL